MKMTYAEMRVDNWRKRGIIGISLEHYDELFVAQGGVCSICSTPPIKRKLDVDHDHNVHGRYNVRGLLCQSCNIRLGNSEAGKTVFTDAQLAYLARFGLEVLA